MKKFNEVRQSILPEAYKQVEVDWDQDRPDRELSGDIKADFGVYVDGYNKKKGTLKVTGSEKELMNWITDTDDLGLGFDKRPAQDIIKKGKNVKESVEVDEAKKLGSRVKITKGRFAGKEGIIRQMDNGKFKGADKSFDIDLDDGKEANGVPGKDIKIVKESVEVDEAKAPKMKGVSIKGSEVTGLRAKDGKLYSAKPLISGGKLSYRVEDEFGGFDTIPLKKFAAKFG
jgi:transcription antitermination factor NusG